MLIAGNLRDSRYVRVAYGSLSHLVYGSLGKEVSLSSLCSSGEGGMRVFTLRFNLVSECASPLLERNRG